MATGQYPRLTSEAFTVGRQASPVESRSLSVREFDNLCSDSSLVAMDLPRKMAWILG